MTKDNLLTVAIPAYNRPKALKKILGQLKNQSKHKFTILVSDDKSPQNLKPIVEEFQKDMPNIVYNRNSKNLGYSGNVCMCYELVKTRYVWLLCDDDTVLPGAVDTILDTLVKHEPVVTLFNFEQLDSFGRHVTGGVTSDTIYTKISQLTDYQPLQRLTFLSIIVLEKRLPIEKLKQTNYQDNVFFQITLSLMLLSDKFKFCEIAKTILYRNVGYKYGDFFKFYLVDHLKAVYLLDHKFDNQKFIQWSIKDLPNALQLYLSQKLGLFEYKAKPTQETKNYITQFYGIYSYIIFAFPIIYALTPTLLLKVIYFMLLVKFHGVKKAKNVYAQNINRAFSDSRKTEFGSYR